MDLVASLVRNGHVVDIALALIVLEAALLAWIGRRRARPLLGVGLFAHLAAGACLLMALKSALVTAGWQQVALWLLGGLVAHAVDLGVRLKGDA